MHRRKFLMGAAISGIVAGSTVLLADDKKKDKVAKHDCKGKNECKGQGGCKAGAAGCAGKNECKGQGGCSTMAKKEKPKKPTS
jgi:hypothetical protein